MVDDIIKKTRSYSMESFYKTIGKSRQLYWQTKKNNANKKEEIENIIEIVLNYRENHPKMGSRVLYSSILNSGITLNIGINKFEKIISNEGLGVKIKSKKIRTSDGKGKENYKNLTHGLDLKDINQLIVGDITYYDIKGKWHYIFTLKDVYSQLVVGLVASKTMEHKNAIKCLAQLKNIRKREDLKNCIHHTDNGSQYNAIDYKSELKSLGMKISRAEGCKQNGSAEQINHILKNMYFDGWIIETFADLKKACKRFKFLNNNERTIKQLGYLTPIQFEQKIKKMKKENRPVKKMFNFTKD